MRARMRRDFGAVEEIGNRILAANSRNDFVQRALARQFDELGQPDRAVAHWQVLRDSDPRDFEASFHLAHAHTRAGENADNAVVKATAGATAVFRKHLLAVLEDHDADQAFDPGLKNVVICGVSYSGSTLIDRLLGGLPGTASIGESHWLTKARSAQGYGPIDFDVENPAQLVACSGCGPGCEVLTFPFRRRLAADHTNWFYKIAKQLRTHTLISADKNPPKIAEHDPLMRFDALVIFKSLHQAWLSELKKRKKGESETFYIEECRKYVSVWTQSYQMFLDDFFPAGRTAFLYFEDFVRNPNTVFERAANALSLEFDEGVLSSLRPGHAIGGNASAMTKLRQARYVPEIEPLESPELPQSHIAIIDQSDEARDVLARLKDAHKRLMDS